MILVSHTEKNKIIGLLTTFIYTKKMDFNSFLAIFIKFVYFIRLYRICDVFEK